MEQWKPIKDYEGIYEVSSWGRVRSLDRLVTKTSSLGNTYTILQKGSIKTPTLSAYGYHIVSLYKDNRAKHILVHRLVAFAFIPKVEGKDHINHINLDKTDNRVENLEWVDIKENNHHAIEHGRGGVIKCRKSVTILRDGKEIGTFPTICDAAKFLGCKQSDIAHTLHGRQKSARGCTFRVK